MANRTTLEQEIYEQIVQQGVDEYSADHLAREAAADAGEYDTEGGEHADS